MKVRASHVIGLNVLTLDEGKEIATVKDVIYDPKDNKVKALLIDGGGWFADAKVIRIEDVKSIGRDDVVVQRALAIRKATDVGRKVAHIAKNDTYLTKTTVITEAGTKLGQVSDIYFDSKTGAVSEFEVTQGIGSGKKQIKIRDLVTVGTDATIVKAYTEEKFQEQAQQQGVQGALHQLQESSQQLFAKAKQTTQTAAVNLQQQSQQLSKQATQKFQELRESPQLKAQLYEVQEKGAEFQKITQEKLHEVKNSPETEKQLKEVQEKAAEFQKVAEEKLQQAGQYMQQQVKENSQRSQQRVVSSPRPLESPNPDDITIEGVDRIVIPPPQAVSMSGMLGGQAQQKKPKKKMTKTKKKKE